MTVRTLILGSLATNCYIVVNNKKALIIDPADDAKKIKRVCEDVEVEGILITHHHPDHIGALKELEEYYHVKHNDFHHQSFNYEVIETPGHTEDSKTFYFKEYNMMFTGDFIFNHSCGRCDLEGGSEAVMQESLAMIRAYPDKTIIYPGHGEMSVLGEEKPLFEGYFPKL